MLSEWLLGCVMEWREWREWPVGPFFLEWGLDFWPRVRGGGLVSSSVRADVAGASEVVLVETVSVSLWWRSLVPVAASVSPDVGGPPVSGRRWSCWLACWCVRATVSGFARGAFGDLGVSFVASALPVGGVCRVVS